MKRIYFGDNLPILESLPSQSIDLIYIDPPFNTGKTQTLKKIKTLKTENGDRKGFNGNLYTTIEIGSKAYKDSFNFKNEEEISTDTNLAFDKLAPHSSKYFLEIFLKPRLNEAYRLLKPNGSLYFHIDYREVHYCKVLLDNIFGRDNFINEIIWAYDFGGRAKSRWPTKHDNILFYVKDKKNYIFNTNEIDRERYMAPGLVGQVKAEKGKLPTDTWFWPYVGMRNTDTWWQTIVGTNSKERLDYPTQKPRRLLDRIIKASTFQDGVVLDFFAGSGTVGESCLALKRNFILIDNNFSSLEVMANRFAGISEIEWINYQPNPKQLFFELKQNENIPLDKSILKETSAEFRMLASTASYLQKELEEISDLWKNSPFEWVLQLPARKKGKLGRNLVASWLESNKIITQRGEKSSETLVFNGATYSIKFSTLWTDNFYQFQQIKKNGNDFLLCFGLSPFSAHCWIFPIEYALEHAKPQHKSTISIDYWFSINPNNVPDWADGFGGSLEDALKLLKNK